MRRLVDMQYERNDMNLVRGKFRMRGDSITIQPSYEELAVRIDFFGDEVERIIEIDPLTGELLAERDCVDIYPGEALRHVARQARSGDATTSRSSCASALLELRATGQDPRGGAARRAHELRPRDAARGGLLLRHRELQPAPRAPRARAARRGRCSTTSRTTS